MNILVLQETDWLIRGPNTQHHVFERLSRNPNIKIIVIDYDIEKKIKAKTRIIKKKKYTKVSRSVKDSHVVIVRTAHIQIPYLRRISSLITNFFEILKIIRTSKPDVIIGFSITNGFIGLILSKIFRIPYIFYYIDLLHTLVPLHSIINFARIITRFLFKFSDLVIVVTKLLQKYVISEGISPNKIKLILNGISLENTKVDKEKYLNLRKKLEITENDFVILYLGHLYEFAGLEEIIEFYDNKVKDGEIKLKFIIIGDGGIYESLKKYCINKNTNWVILTGRLPFFELPEYIQLANLCLSSFEYNDITKYITPVKIMEYMAMKKPVLSTRLPNIIYEIGEDNGVIFAKNQKQLIKLISLLSHQKKKLEEIGLKGYNLILKNYLWSNLLQKFKQIIIKLKRSYL